MSLRLIFSLCLCTAAVARDDVAIKELGEGKRQEARADWWGFDEHNATHAIQSAINSKAKKVIIANRGKPWNVLPLKLASDQEIVFEQGVVVQAVRGAFKSPNSMLLLGTAVKNVTLSGEGATLRMWKADYQAEPYQKSEWRHALALYACDNVVVKGLVLADSGGDGIYVGAGPGGIPCRKVSLRNLTCTNHHRQGISVISAEDLVVEDCTFSHTAGTAPQAGIDFEPNASNEHLKGCVLRRCTFNNNRSYGILFALGKLDYHSDPLDVRVENCRTLGGQGAVRVSVGNPFGVRGRIGFERCRFEGSSHYGIGIDNKAVKGAAIIFDHCDLVNVAGEEPGQSPILIKGGGNCTETLGGVEFEACTIQDQVERQPLNYDDVGGVRLKEITGTLDVKTGGKTTHLELNQAVLDKWFPWSAELKEYARFDGGNRQFVPAFPDARRPLSPLVGWLRGTAQFVVWGREGEPMAFTITLKPVGKGTFKSVPVRLISPSGKVTELPAPLAIEPRKYEYRATETGLHRVVVEAGNHTAMIQSTTDHASLMSMRGDFHFVGRAGPLYFLVPKGVSEFAVKVAGGGGRECVKAAITGPDGRVAIAKDNIGRGEQLPVKRADASRAEVWSLTLERPSQGVLEDVQVLMEGVPPLLSASPETILQPAGLGSGETPGG